MRSRTTCTWKRVRTAVTYEHICMFACGCNTNRNSSEFAFSKINQLFSARKLLERGNTINVPKDVANNLFGNRILYNVI